MENDVAVKKQRRGAKDVVSKKVGIMSVVGLFYAMCCAGAFGVEEMIPESGPGITILMLIFLPFVWALPYSFIVAELGSARPVEGGNIIWVKEALGEYWFGIMVIVNFIWGLVANTEYVVLAVSYLGQQIELNSYQAYAIKIGLILIFFVINALGVKEVSATSTILSVAVLGAFIMVAIVGFAHMDSNPFTPFFSNEYGFADDPGFKSGFMTIGAALGIGMWMYSGFDEISLVAGEIKQSSRIIPKALMIVIPLMVLTYVLPTIAGLGSVGEWESWTTEPDGVGYHTVFSLIENPAVGATLGVIFIVVAIIGQCSIYNMCVMVGARSAMVMSDEHFGPKSLAKLTSKRGTPLVALIVVVVVTTLLLGTPESPLDFSFLVLVDVFFTVIVCALTVVSYIVLKKRIPAEEIPFKAPGGKVGPVLFCSLTLFFCVAIVLVNGTDYFLGGFIVMLLIPVLYVIAKWVWKGTTVSEPKLYPMDPRTKLGFGDVSKLGGYYMGFGILGIITRYFLEWYEGDWAAGYWAAKSDFGDWEYEALDTYKELVANEGFAPLPEANAAGEIYIPGYYDAEYGYGTFFGSFDTMLDAILSIGIVAAVLGVVLSVIGISLRKGEDAARNRIAMIS